MTWYSEVLIRIRHEFTNLLCIDKVTMWLSNTLYTVCVDKAHDSYIYVSKKNFNFFTFFISYCTTIWAKMLFLWPLTFVLINHLQERDSTAEHKEGYVRLYAAIASLHVQLKCGIVARTSAWSITYYIRIFFTKQHLKRKQKWHIGTARIILHSVTSLMFQKKCFDKITLILIRFKIVKKFLKISIIRRRCFFFLHEKNYISLFTL